MTKKKIYLIIIISIILLGGIIFFIYKFTSQRTKTSNTYPKIELIGDKIIYLPLGEAYIEPGYTATDEKDGDITSKVEINKNIDTNHIGTYEIKYKVTNSLGNSTSERRFISIKLSNKVAYKDSYDNIDNTIHGWGTNNKKDGQRPKIDLSNEELAKYNAYAMGPDEKVLYLTFDEGSLDTYLPEIVDILNNNNIKGTFFLCNKYIASNPDLIKKMTEEGHSIGNHTMSHLSMPTLANRTNFSKYLDELIVTEETYEKITGKPMDHIYREPRGEYSLRSLTIIKDLGYKTYFWSSAYQDWDDKLTKEDALSAMTSRVHNGAIYLLHPNSKGNYLALDSFIKKMKKEGYSFDLVKNIK